MNRVVKDTKKKVWKSFEVSVELIDGVSGVYDNVSGFLTLKGAKGEVSKKMKYPGINVVVEGSMIFIRVPKYSKSEKKISHTYRAHIRNMMLGVTEGFTYTLRVVHAKFPMKIEKKGDRLQLQNFLGEKITRFVNLPEDVKVDVKGSDIVLNGVDKEKVGQVAGSIEQMTKISHLDRRVIQDGIYIVSKPHKEYV